MMGLGNCHPAGTCDISFEFIRIFEELRIVLGTHYDQGWHLYFGKSFIRRGVRSCLGAGSRTQANEYSDKLLRTRWRAAG